MNSPASPLCGLKAKVSVKLVSGSGKRREKGESTEAFGFTEFIQGIKIGIEVVEVIVVGWILV